MNDVQHVVGFSRLERDDGVQRMYKTIAEMDKKYIYFLLMITSFFLLVSEGQLIGYLLSWHSLMGAGS